MKSNTSDMYSTLVSLLVRLKEENIDLLDFYTNLETNKEYMSMLEPYLHVSMTPEEKQEFILAIKLAVQSAYETLKMLKV